MKKLFILFLTIGVVSVASAQNHGRFAPHRNNNWFYPSYPQQNIYGSLGHVNDRYVAPRLSYNRRRYDYYNVPHNRSWININSNRFHGFERH